jgi:hypothetical protein
MVSGMMPESSIVPVDENCLAVKVVLRHWWFNEELGVGNDKSGHDYFVPR